MTMNFGDTSWCLVKDDARTTLSSKSHFSLFDESTESMTLIIEGILNYLHEFHEEHLFLARFRLYVRRHCKKMLIIESP